MRSLYDYWKRRPLAAAILVAVLLCGLMAIRMEVSALRQRQQRQQAQQALLRMAEANGFSPLGGGWRPARAPALDPKVLEIMQRYHLGPKAAKYISLAKMQLLEQTDTSVHVVITFPDKLTVDEAATVAADPDYTPGASDLDLAAGTGAKVHGPRVTLAKRSDGQGWTYTLRYHVPYGSLPPALLEKIRPGSGRTASVSDLFLGLIPEARAQEAPAQGKEQAGEAAISIVANFLAEAYKNVDWSKVTSYSQLAEESEVEAFETEGVRSLGADVPLSLIDAGEDYVQLKGWLNQVSSVEDCARNPTNALTQKASNDPNYQHEVIDQVNEAWRDVFSTLVPSLASDAAGYLGHFLPFGVGAVAGLVFSTQDAAVSEYANARIADATKNVVPCRSFVMLPTDLRPMLATVEYKFNEGKGQGGRNETRSGEGKVDMEIMKGGLYGEAPAKLSIEITEPGNLAACPSQQHVLKAGDDAHITATGGTGVTNGVIELRINGDLKVHEEGPVGEEYHCVHQTRDYVQYYGYVCRFTDVDFKHGGTFTTFAGPDGQDGHGTCRIDLARK